MPKYRKLPVVIEAYQFQNKVCQPNDDRPSWLIDAEMSRKIEFYDRMNGPPFLMITTLEGRMRADPDDWIIQGVNGEIYPCKPDVFAKTYEPVNIVEWTDAEQLLISTEVARAVAEMVINPDGPAVDTTDITEGALDPAAGDNSARSIAESIVFNPTRKLVDDISNAIEAARQVAAQRAAVGFEARIAELEAQLQAEGEHTAAATANIDRLNTEIERITRRQQGPLMGKD